MHGKPTRQQGDKESMSQPSIDPTVNSDEELDRLLLDADKKIEMAVQNCPEAQAAVDKANAMLEKLGDVRRVLLGAALD